MAESSTSLESIKKWVVEHKLRAVGNNLFDRPLLFIMILLFPFDEFVDDWFGCFVVWWPKRVPLA